MAADPGVLIGWKFDLCVAPLLVALAWFVWPWIRRHFAMLERESEVIVGADVARPEVVVEARRKRGPYDWATEEHLVYEIERRRDGRPAAAERRMKRLLGLYSYTEPE